MRFRKESLPVPLLYPAHRFFQFFHRTTQRNTNKPSSRFTENKTRCYKHFRSVQNFINPFFNIRHRIRGLGPNKESRLMRRKSAAQLGENVACRVAPVPV